MSNATIYIGSLIFFPFLIMGLCTQFVSGTNDPMIAYILAMLVTHLAYGKIEKYVHHDIKNTGITMNRIEEKENNKFDHKI